MHIILPIKIQRNSISSAKVMIYKKPFMIQKTIIWIILTITTNDELQFYDFCFVRILILKFIGSQKALYDELWLRFMLFWVSHFIQLTYWWNINENAFVISTQNKSVRMRKRCDVSVSLNRMNQIWMNRQEGK